MKDLLERFVKLVRERHEACHGNEAATKQSLIAPLFVILGYDMTDPRECKPEFKANFGENRSVKPIDWAFCVSDAISFLVEAKAEGKKIGSYDEQLGDYYAKCQPGVTLGILTTGTQWRFFTDLDAEHVMDKKPFLTWNVLTDDIPVDFLTILQKSQFKPQLVKTFAEREHHQNLLVAELTRLLEPSPDFVKLAIQNIETRRVTDGVIDTWKPVLVNAINEWAHQHTLAVALRRPVENGDVSATSLPDASRAGPKKGKVCPQCSSSVGCRTKKCACGFVFISENKSELADVSTVPDLQENAAG
jgi:hypothetical protein